MLVSCDECHCVGTSLKAKDRPAGKWKKEREWMIGNVVVMRINNNTLSVMINVWIYWLFHISAWLSMQVKRALFSKKNDLNYFQESKRTFSRLIGGSFCNFIGWTWAPGGPPLPRLRSSGLPESLLRSNEGLFLLRLFLLLPIVLFCIFCIWFMDFLNYQMLVWCCSHFISKAFPLRTGGGAMLLLLRTSFGNQKPQNAFLKSRDSNKC